MQGTRKGFKHLGFDVGVLEKESPRGPLRYAGPTQDYARSVRRATEDFLKSSPNFQRLP